MRVRMEVGGCCTKPRDYLCVGYIILVSLNNLSYVHFRGLSLAGGHENLLFLFHIRVLDASFPLFSLFHSSFIYFSLLHLSVSLVHLLTAVTFIFLYSVPFTYVIIFPSVLS